MATFSVFSGSSSFQKKPSSGKKQESLPTHKTSWKCRAKVTMQFCNRCISDVKSNVNSVLVVNNNMVNIKWYVPNTTAVNLNASWGHLNNLSNYLKAMGDEHFFDKYEFYSVGTQYSQWIIVDMGIVWITFIYCTFQIYVLL